MAALVGGKPPKAPVGRSATAENAASLLRWLRRAAAALVFLMTVTAALLSAVVSARASISSIVVARQAAAQSAAALRCLCLAYCSSALSLIMPHFM